MVQHNHASNVPIRDRARDELRECRSLISSLFVAQANLLKSISTASDDGKRIKDTKRDPTQESVQIMEKLVTQVKSFHSVMEQVLEHQRLHGIIEELRKANSVEDAKIAHLGANLRAAESVLQNSLDEAKPRLAAFKRANKRPIDVDEVISYGSKISASLSAPLGWDPSQPLGNFLPPAPTEEMMRAGKLGAVEMEEEKGAELSEKARG
ncbi:Mediator of RNA polymerase II transcription subunit 4 [Gracilariopsis chorda]|uniref:Mediator of RNA polymerase II transcription subunit 4 n=1 Tax=Gracilariopsis chorda TaxID=448386 RepID=A0A2V3J6B5_9FLOR|nr:Mediator of RNA polymerase II transcription subunit 4 [Gracilariopsis chorda]|eukprot:PXF49914.1 Mediator of RNA polymerase II transcription subunit 4 [Gracilariopsis chorda]